MQKAYYIYTLSATEIIKNCYSSKKELPEKIELDLNNKSVYDSVVKSFALFPESAFFHQLEQSIIANDESKKTDDNILSEHLVFVDFENLFSQSGSSKMKDVIKYYFFEQPKKKNENRGLHIKFYGQEKFTRLIPFDKSNSMARNSRMSFLDFKYKKKMNNRIMLDIEMKQAALNKLYAYRGLYLTAATRIEPQKNIFELNEKTVVVIDDDESLVKIEGQDKEFNILTAKIDGTKTKSDDKKKTEVYKKWIGETKDTKVELNRFDGEGLISFQFRDYIVHTLGDDAYSFQVRLPFGKGMLHTVDFHGMIKEALGSNSLAEIKIKDVFGIDRDLSKVQIILTKSMFKCFYWLKSFCEKKDHHKDPMKYYFEKMEIYNHSLYISNTDAMLKNETKKVTLSYQFLNPMKFDGNANSKADRLLALTNKHFEEAGKIKNNKYYQKQGAKRERAEQIAENSEREEIEEKTETWLAVLSEDNRVIKEPKIAGKLNGMYQSQLKNTVFGKLVVEGELRFLSRDLVALCYHLVNQCEKIPSENPKGFFKHNILFDEKISMPGRAIAVECGANLALFRNPHLSRNEEWLSKYFENDFRKNYLGHLKGVVEIGYNSIANLALGGADFDGDLVKIIKDSAVVEAVKDGCYIEENGEMKRNIPVIEIPVTPKPQELPVNDYTMNFEVIKRTFSSRIGEISNATIKAGYFQYKKEDERLIENNICAMATILTGLEIDSCKNGEKPDIKPVTKFWDDEKKDDASKTESTPEQTEQPIAEDGVSGDTKTEKAYSKKFDYIKQKNEIEKMDAVKIQVEEKNHETPEKRGYEIYTSKNINKMFIPYMEEDKEKKFADIDKLFYYYAKKKVEEKETKKEQSPFDLGNNDKELAKKEGLFEELTKEEKKKEKYNKIKDIISAYNDVMSLSGQVYKAKKLHHESRYLKQINSILQLQYDDGVDEKHINSILNFFENFIEDKYEKTFCGAKVSEIEKKIKEITKEEIEWLINDKWQNMRGENKAEKLKEKYGEKLKEEQITLLTNFDCGGYQLLYFFLKEVILTFKESINNNIGLNEVCLVTKKEEKEYFKTYLEIYKENKNKKVPKSTWKKELIKKAREDIKGIFGANFISSLRYVYAISKTIDKNGNFFWDVFTAEEILTAIKKKEGASDAE